MNWCRSVIWVLIVIWYMATADLTKEQQGQLGKTSTDRLRQVLLSAGESEDKVEGMDRPALKEAVAQQKVAATARDMNTELEMKKLELEMRKMEMEERRLERERDVTVEKARMEHEYRMKQLEMAGSGAAQCEQGDEGEDGERTMRVPRWDNSLAARTKRYGEIMRHVLPRMPHEVSDVPQYFENVEHLYEMYEVPADLRAKLIIPQLSDRAKSLISRLAVRELEDYDQLKGFLLSEFKLTATEYKARFDKAVKRNDETHVLFTARLKNALRYYIESRGVHNFEQLCDLIIADKLKSCLSVGVLNYVLSLEGTATFDASEIAKLADTYSNTHVERTGYQGHRPSFQTNRRDQGSPRGRGNYGFVPRGGAAGSGDNRTNSFGHGRGYRSPQAIRRNGEPDKVIRCWRCDSVGHVARFCPAGREIRPPARYNSKAGAQAHCVMVSDQAMTGNSDRQAEQVPAAASQCNKVQVIDVDDAVRVSELCNGSDGQSEIWEFQDYPAVVRCSDEGSRVHSDVLPTPKIKISPLQFVNVLVEGRKFTALSDSGCQIPILNTGVIDVTESRVMGSVNLRGVIGKSVTVPLVSASIKLAGDGVSERMMETLHLTCAVVELNADGYDVILPQDIVCDLQALPSVNVLRVPIMCAQSAGAVMTEKGDGAVCEVDEGDVKVDVCDNSESDEGVCSSDMVNEICDMRHSESLIGDQINDPSLANCRKQAEAGKGGFVISNGAVYHNDKVSDQSVCQLCVPVNRREEVLKLAHDSVFGGHLGERKTRERIRLSFFWPSMRRDIERYVHSCKDCQLRSRPMTIDRVPITPITRAELPFRVMYMDCIGPLEPMSSQGHKYCLCIIDSCTRWPSVYVLKSLTAKAVCDSLLDLFMHVGVPSKIVSDCGSNFTSQLTRGMLERLGCTPTFNTPNHAEASGLVERFNQTFKNMLFHVVRQHGRQWNKFVPFMVWALREVTNSTTNASPYALVYGRTPRGPLYGLNTLPNCIGQGVGL